MLGDYYKTFDIKKSLNEIICVFYIYKSGMTLELDSNKKYMIVTIQ